MKAIGFGYEVSLRLSMTLEETTFLKEVSAHHYDSVCRMLGERGALNGLHNHALYRAEDAAAGHEDNGHPCSARSIDTMRKIMEQAHYHVRSLDQMRVADAIQAGLDKAWEAINTEWQRVVAAAPAAPELAMRLTPGEPASEDA